MSNLEIDQLQKSNRILEQTVQHHRQAFESINDDFVQYQHQTDSIIEDLEQKVSRKDATISQLKSLLKQKEQVAQS